jgi:hypothetical protein
MIRLLIVLLLLCCSPAVAAPGLPADFDPDPSVPTPAEVLGFEPGQWHPRHDQIVTYLTRLAEASDRVHLEIIGQTHGQRPLLLLTFAAPEHLAGLDDLRADRRRASRAGDGPAVIWLGYSVHGNEASGASAALVTAWYLASARNPEVLAWLDEQIIIMEPVLNPDGLDRFAHWVNMHRGRNPVADPADREHHEAWPNGRSNYYWFDLNRDWLPLVHPESRARARQLHLWMPHVLTDHHEMGPNTTYFFQPGVPERNNPLTPGRNYELTDAIARFHGEILDAADEPYFTRELFDDYYLGKGSTYPDLTGGIGILFEQASVRGHVQDTVYGPRHFVDAVANQVRTSLSTLKAGHALADELVDYQREFFNSAREQARRAGHAGWLIGDGGDPVRAHRLIELLLAHDIDIRSVAEAVDIDGHRHEPGSAWAIPADQDQYRFLRSVFEPVTDLPMETFYDVSAWPLALSYDLPLAKARRLPAAGERLRQVSAPTVPFVETDALAWLVPWNQMGAAPLLAALLDDGYRIQASVDPMQVRTRTGERDLVRGSLVIHRGLQPPELDPVGERLQILADQQAVEVLVTRQGLSLSGPDLGSPTVPVLEPVRAALLTGRGLRSTHAGYIWHWFDTRLDQPLTRLDWSGLFEADLSGYTHLILPDGNYEFLPHWAIERITGFVRQGGTLIAARGAAAWVETLELEWSFTASETSESDEDKEEKEMVERRSYGDFNQDFAREIIGGSALNIALDTSHPLAFGYSSAELTVLRRGRHQLKPVDNAYVHAGIYADAPLASGFLSDKNRDRLAGTPALAATHHGEGLVIRMADDYLFRGYWLGSERLFANALFFSQLIRQTQMPE